MAEPKNLIAMRKKWMQAGFEAGLHSGRQQIIDMLSLALREPEVVGTDIHGKDRLLKVVKGIEDQITKYELAWKKHDETDYYRSKMDDALAEAYGGVLRDTFLERYPYAPEYNYKTGKWK